MLSWRGTVDDWAGAGRFRILFPLDDSVIVPGASSETTLAEQMMKLEQRRYVTRGASKRPVPGRSRGRPPNSANGTTSAAEPAQVLYSAAVRAACAHSAGAQRV